MKLNHLSTQDVFNSKLFDNISSYDELENSIVEYSNLAVDRGYEHIEAATCKCISCERKSMIGEAFEVYTEFFFRYYKKEVFLGVTNIHDTSREEMRDGKSMKEGYDFRYTDLHGKLGHIQSKFRQNKAYKFTKEKFRTFICETSLEENTNRDTRIWFTNLYNDNNSMFDSFSLSCSKLFRVIGRLKQEEFIKRDPNFWKEFSLSLKESSIKRTKNAPPKMRDYQQSIIDGINSLY